MSRRFFGRGGGYASESSDGITRNQFAGQHDTVGGVFGIGSQQPLDDPLRRLDAEFAWMGVPMGEEKMIRKHFRLVETENAALIGTAQAMGGGDFPQQARRPGIRQDECGWMNRFRQPRLDGLPVVGIVGALRPAEVEVIVPERPGRLDHRPV